MSTARLTASLALLALWAAAPAFADKTDIIELRNGDRVTGEIKKLDRGQLSLSTNSMGTIGIEWKDIERVTSKELYVIELEDGSRIDGRLGATLDGGQLVVASGADARVVPMDDVIWIDPLKIDGSRFKRWDGSISAGFDATKANNDNSLSMAFSARRRAEAFRIDLDGSVYSRSQDGAEANAERNDELGIDLRTLAGGGFGRYLVQTGRSLWSVTGGSVLVNEQRAGNESSETNVEGFFSTAFEFFTYDTPKTSLTTILSVFPSITDAGRVRGNLDITLRRELVKDLFFDLSFYQSYDSEPPDEGQSSDYGIVTSLGYSF